MTREWTSPDGAIRLIHGDCLEVLPTLDADSVDSIVCDPPYGLEFMGKEWDRLGDVGKTSHSGIDQEPGFKGFRLPNYNGSANKKCRTCGRWAWDYPDRKCTCERPDFPNVKAHQAAIMQAWHHQWAVEAFRVLKPGAHLLAFGGTRTYHRMVCAIEDAGFEIRDCIMWVYGSGFPKSLDVSKQLDRMAGAEREVVAKGKAGRNALGQDSGWNKTYNPDQFDITAPATEAARQWDGWGTALKPSVEPVVVARKPLISTVAANVLRYGTGAINVDACRVDGPGWTKPDGASGAGFKTDKFMGAAGRGEPTQAFGVRESTQGRWPANLILSYPSDLYELRDDVTTDQLRALVEHLVNRGRVEAAREVVGGFPETSSHDTTPGGDLAKTSAGTSWFVNHHTKRPIGRGDSGSSARFFKNCPPDALSELPPDLQALFVLCPNPGKDEVVGGFPETDGAHGGKGNFRQHTWAGSGIETEQDIKRDAGGSAARFFYCAKSSSDERGDSRHPTIKPLDLIEYLIRLVTPPGGTCLDPFLGSGTTAAAAHRQNFRCIGIEREAEYFADCIERMERELDRHPLFDRPNKTQRELI